MINGRQNKKKLKNYLFFLSRFVLLLFLSYLKFFILKYRMSSLTHHQMTIDENALFHVYVDSFNKLCGQRL